MERVRELKKLFSIDLSNGEERLKIHLTLSFMELEQLRNASLF